MATQSRKESKLYLRSKEGTAGTQDDYDFCEAKSVIMTKPNPVFLHEMDRGKLGAGEHGRLAEVQAVYTPFSLKCSRLTEWLYFMSYFQGQTDTVETVDTGVYKHELEHLPVTSRTLPTFSATYYDGNGAQVMTHCIINEFSTTFGSGGNGIVDATFSGFCNLHYDSSGTITINADT
ncbi:MAG: hypothetical protein KJ556_21440, partial [Gammaproteobacteria bacterium]|nr:hypothetical protein [Gammaproteobacteria bacterium]